MTGYPGLELPDDQEVLWWLLPDGRVVGRSVPQAQGGAAADPVPPAGGTPITAEEAADRLTRIRAANDTEAARQSLAAARQAEADYQQLLHIKVPEHLARRLTGHEPGRVTALRNRIAQAETRGE